MSARSRPAAGEQLWRTLRRYEGPLGDATEPSIVWQRAEGATVWDADGRAYTDLSSGFGVAAVGHRNPRVVAAIHRQADLLLHGLGDLHPTDVRARLAERLAGLAPFGLTRMLFQLTGAGAVELALKTSHLATGRAVVVGFGGGYHGTGLGALAAGGWPEFRDPFRAWLAPARIEDYGGVRGYAAEMMRSNGYRSAVAAPVMVAAGRVWGLVLVASEHALGEDAEHRLAGFAELVALSLESAEARAELKASRMRILEA
ncbi:MAG TPA: aminotransferase class III-fold pyridoxal phosphate-dependent enzyme, partial [Gaiellales bacterium]|nr:aminotransferase class III-fold pyridoxal phosphate-dependent enzyme [Gaiellales bacterium]